MHPIKRLFTNVTAATWLRDQQRDLHLIYKTMRRVANSNFEAEFTRPMADNLLPKVLADWLQIELPNTPVGIIRKLVFHDKHYWESWFVPYVDFSSQELARYKNIWEGADQRGRTAGFWRKTLNYGVWRAELSSIKVYDQARQSPAAVLWFDTPVGLLWCPWDMLDDCAEESHKKHMIWLRIQELFPGLLHVPLHSIVTGSLEPDTSIKGAWSCVVSIPHRCSMAQAMEYKSQYVGEGPLLTPHQRALCSFLGTGGALITFLDDGWG